MKKWLVGLVAASLCAASAWAASYTLITSASEVTEGNYVIVAGQGDSAMKNVADSSKRISAGDVSVEDGVIRDPDASVIWTLSQDGDKWLISSEAESGTVYAAAPATADNKSRLLATPDGNYTLWSIGDSATAGLIAVQSEQFTDRFLQKNNTGAFFACYKGTQKDVRFFKEGSPEFAVEVEPSGEFRQDTGEWVLTEGTSGAILTAVAKNGEGDVSYAWTGSFEGSNEILPIPDGLSVDDVPVGYTVTVTATDSSEPPQTATAEFSFTLVQAPQAYTVTVDDGIENGTVQLFDGETELANGEAVYEGTTVKVVATPTDRSFKVEAVGVAATDDPSTTVPLENGEFTMPGFNVTVTAAFAPWEGTAYALVESMDDFEAGADYLIVAGTDAMKNEPDSGRIAVSAVEITDGVVATEDDSIVWTIDNGSDSKYTLHNAAADVYVSAPSYETTGAASLVEAGTAAEAQWTIAIDDESALATIGSIYDGKSLMRNSSHPYFAVYSGGTKPSLYKKVGAGVFSISLDPSGEDVVFTEGEGGTITASAKNAQGAVTYTWNWTEEGPGSASEDGSQWVIPADAPTGSWTLYCSATDEMGNEADASVSFSILKVYEVTIDGDIVGGSVVAEPMSGVEETSITVTATAEPGYKCESIIVNGESFAGSSCTFDMPVGGALVSAVFVESTKDTYVPVTKAVDFAAGEEYLVVAHKEDAFTSALKNEANGTRIGTEDVSIEEDGSIQTDSAAIVWKIQAGANEGEYVLFNEAGGVYAAATKNDNVAQLLTNGTAALAQWTLDLSALPEIKITSVSYPARWLQRNSQADYAYFATYTGTQTTPMLFKKAGPAVFSVSLDDTGFELPVGEGRTVTATAENGEGEITYSWSSETLELNGSGPVLEIPGTLDAGEYAATVTAMDSSDPPQTATAELTFKVVAPPEPCTVSIADGIENGSVALIVDGEPVAAPAELLEGTEVTVEATPEDGFELEAITVNGEPIGGNTFTVAGDSEVSATFAKIVDYATLPFLAEDTPFTGPWQNPKARGVTSEGLDTDYNSQTDGRGAKFDSAGDWVKVKFEGTPGELSYALKLNGSGEEAYEFAVEQSATGEEGSWTAVATYPEDGELKGSKAGFTNELNADSRFVRFTYVMKADRKNVALYDVYIANGGFSVNVDKNGFELEQGKTETVTAEAKNGVEPYDYLWNGGSTPELGGSGPVLEIPGTLEPGDYSVTVTASDSSAEPQTAEAVVTFTVTEAKPTFTVTVAEGIENGEVALFVAGEAVETPAELAEGTDVTVVATPFAGFKTAGITVNGDALTGDTFTVTADAEVSATFVDRGDEFVKITTLDELEEGEYVITGAGTGGEFAMLAQLSESGTPCILRQEEAVEIENGDTIAGPDASIVWSVGKVADGWTISNGAIGFVGYVDSGNSAGAEEEASEKSTWNISESGGLFLLTNVGNTGRILLYNSGSPRFACYTGTSSSIKPLAFYKKSGPAVFGVTVSDTGFELTKGEGKTVTASAKNGAEPYSYAWASDTEALNGIEGAELSIPGTLEPGAYRATVTATDSSEPKQTETAVVEFTVVAPLPVYTVTVAEGIENGSVTVDKTEAEEGETVTVTATPAENYKLVAILVNGNAIEGNTFEIAGNSVVSATFAEIVKYPVTVDQEIPNGSISADKEEAEAGEIVTLTANPDAGWKLETFLLGGEPFEGNTFVMPEGEALVSATFVETVQVTFVPVERATDFVAGEEYLLVACKEDAYTSAMKNVANGTRIGVDEVEIAEDGSITTDNADIVWTIRAGEGEGQYVLFSETGGVYAAGPDSAGNNAQLVADGTNALAQWKLDFAALPEVKIASVSYDGRWLQRNSDKNNKYFATYSSAQVDPLLFKKAGFSVGFTDKEDGFTVEAGTADSITAEAVRGVEPYCYAWTGDLEGDGATLEIPDTLAEGEYSVTVTAWDSTEPEPQTAKASISFTVVTPTQTFTVTVDPEIANGEVTVDKATAAADEDVTVTATPTDGFALAGITVSYGDEVLSFNSSPAVFPMPASDVVVSATFAEIVDYATLPFVDTETPYPGPWKEPAVPGLTNDGLDSDYNDGSAQFDSTGAWMQIKFRGTPGTLAFGIKGNGVNEEDVSTFVVLESADGETWTPVAVFTTDDNLTNSRRDMRYTLSEDSRYVRFLYEEKVVGNVGIYDVYIGEAGAAEPAVTVAGETTLTLGGTFALELGLENYTGEYTWAWAPEIVGYVDPETATWWWTPTETQVGETEVTFSAMDGDRTIVSETVTLTVEAPAEPTVALVDGATTVELGDYFLLEFALSNYEGAFEWTVVEGPGEFAEGLYTWTPETAGPFTITVAAVDGETVIATSEPVELTVTGETPQPVQAKITRITVEETMVTLEYTGDATEAWGTDDLTVDGSWVKVESAMVEGGTAIVPKGKPFLRLQ